MNKNLALSVLVTMPFALAALVAHPAWAQQPPMVLPGSADPSRIEQRLPPAAPPPALEEPAAPGPVAPQAQAPKGSENIVVQLNSVEIQGMTRYSQEDMADLYRPYVGHKITVDMAWVIAAQITKRYQDAGYFLTKARVPSQDITEGSLLIKVDEGYIGEVAVEPSLEQCMAHEVIDKWVARLRSYKPLSSRQLESALLQLNDIPGVSLRAVLEPMDDKVNPGAVKLSLIEKPSNGPQSQVSFDNFGSRFLGPYEASAQTQMVILPNQLTTLSFLASTPTDEVKYGSIKQQIPVAPAVNLEVFGNHVKSNPGDDLKIEDIDSRSTQLGAGLAYQAIRQRDENLTLRFSGDDRRTNVDILDTKLTRDDVRAMRASADYQTFDHWSGTDTLSATLSQGLGSPNDGTGDLYYSRTEAEPWFTKLEVSASRLQAFSEDWGVITSATAQLSAEPLFSSEEFGYGGQSFGRAFDNSELLGDDGAAMSVELRYGGIDPWRGFKVTPYGFYDAGIVWNYDQEQEPRAFGSSAGFGLLLNSEAGLSANAGLAFPISRAIQDPVYGNGKSPRFLLQMQYGF